MSSPDRIDENDLSSENVDLIPLAKANPVGDGGNGGGTEVTGLGPREGKTTCCVGCIPLVVATLVVPLLTLRYGIAWYGPLVARGAACPSVGVSPGPRRSIPISSIAGSGLPVVAAFGRWDKGVPGRESTVR
jgi:hypothetical protein